jgi:hypothetical protein
MLAWNWSVLYSKCSCNHKMGQNTIKNTITTYPCMDYYNPQESRLYSWVLTKQQLILATRIFSSGLSFVAISLSQNIAWYSFPEILPVGLGAKTRYLLQINENAGVRHCTYSCTWLWISYLWYGVCIYRLVVNIQEKLCISELPLTYPGTGIQNIFITQAASEGLRTRTSYPTDMIHKK